jgi:hypothetical protein
VGRTTRLWTRERAERKSMAIQKLDKEERNNDVPKKMNAPRPTVNKKKENFIEFHRI